MRLVSWLDQLSARHGRKRLRNWLRWQSADVELLEDRTQLTAMTYAATDLPLLVPPDGPVRLHRNVGHDNSRRDSLLIQLLDGMPQARTTVTRRSGTDT